jgi:hypothetical protein
MQGVFDSLGLNVEICGLQGVVARGRCLFRIERLNY